MKSLGDNYETRAVQWLQDQGLQLLVRNYKGKTGEIDIVAKDKNTLVFVEVRARNNRYFASAAASVDRRKQLRILRTAQLFLQRHPGLANMPCRFDVIAFEPRQSTTSPEIHWIRSAFTA
ncbi:MAG: YraN family protein [Gammaproteobacteria bacterium]|nr:MAG: YraN family protein [Gammaproteobacteria bacterium]RLA56746.1 MAG: YraN family protein [Gammaproteobacteria bacterium]HDY83192.1 YraN family protein [Halieaceae bacterium]